MRFLVERLAVALLIAGLSFSSEAMPAPSEQASAQEQEEEPGPLRLVYKGEPLAVELQCAWDHFRRAATVCSEAMPCELYLELTAVEQGAERVFLIGNLHTSSATVSSILLKVYSAG